MNIKKFFLIGAVLVGTAVPATAQIGFQVSFGGSHHGRNFQISVGSRSHKHHYDRRGQHGRQVRGRGHSRVGLGFRYVNERVWVPGPLRRVYVPARYGYRYDACGRRVRYRIVQAHYEVVQDPGCWEVRRRQVWVGH